MRDCCNLRYVPHGTKRIKWVSSAVQCSAVQCSAVQCSEVQCSAVQCSAVQYSSVQFTLYLAKGFLHPEWLMNYLKYHRIPKVMVPATFRWVFT